MSLVYIVALMNELERVHLDVYHDKSEQDRLQTGLSEARQGLGTKQQPSLCHLK